MRRPGKLSLITTTILFLAAGGPWLTGSAGAAEADGFLYGTVLTEGGRRYTGVLRWGGEEAFWDDLFNGTKSKLPYIDRLPEDKRKRREIKVFGLRISYDWDEEATGRQFEARFGDIQEIRPTGGEKVDVKMKSGTVYRLDDGSNDIGATIGVQDPDVGDVEIEWKRIERIEFADRFQLVAEVAEHESDQTFGLAALVTGRIAGLNRDHGERAGHRHPGERRGGYIAKPALATRGFAANEVVQADPQHPGDEL